MEITFRQVNAYAMQHGMFLGAAGVAMQVLFYYGLLFPAASAVFTVLFLFMPVLAWWLTRSFRTAVVGTSDSFPWKRGFQHALFTCYYAGLWVSLFTYSYLRFFDNGRFFATYRQSLSSPEMMRALEESGVLSEISAATDGGGLAGMIDILESTPPVVYAAGVLYLVLFVAPLWAIVAGLLLRRG